MIEAIAAAPLISIVMPTYNRAGLIGETIASIRNQTYKNWELIIVDDGSTDNTAEIVNNLGDERIRYFSRYRTAIGGEVKNAGLEKASGSFIAFIDSDDLWHPAKLEKQLVTLQQFPDAGFCLCGGYNFSEPDKPLRFYYKRTEGVYYGNIFCSFFESGWPAYTQALLVRKECFLKSGTFPSRGSFAGGDLDFLLSLALHFNAAIIYEPLFFHRLHSHTYSITEWEHSSLEGIRAIRYHSHQKNLPVAEGREALFKARVRLGEKYLQHGYKRRAIAVLLKAWTDNPFKWVAVKKLGKGVFYNRSKVRTGS